MWKIIIGSLLVGLLEVLIVIFLHERFSLWELFGLYLASTLMALVVVFVMQRKLFKDFQYLGKKKRKRLESKLKAKEPLNEKERVQAKQMFGMVMWTLAMILVFIPGFLTDLLGVLLVLPFFSDSVVPKALVEPAVKVD